MAQRVTHVLVSDLTDEEMEPGEGQTVPFALDGVEMEIDLFDDQAESLREALAPYIAAARRTGGRAKRGTASKSAARSASGYSREQSAEIRRWGKEQGWEVSDRGRLSGPLAEAWEQAHQGSAA